MAPSCSDDVFEFSIEVEAPPHNKTHERDYYIRYPIYRGAYQYLRKLLNLEASYYREQD